MCHYRQINRWASELSTSFLLTLFLALFTLNKFEYSRWIKRLGFSFSRLSDAISRHVLIIIDLSYCKKKFSKFESVLVPLLKFILILIIFLLWKNVPCYLFPSCPSRFPLARYCFPSQLLLVFPVGKYLFKVDNKDTKTTSFITSANARESLVFWRFQEV